MNQTPDDILTRLADAETISDQAERTVLILAEREEVTITWSRYAAGGRGPDLHVHREHTDAFYVLDGELTFELGPQAERVRVPKGGFAAVPPNVVHTFVNDGPAEATWLNLHAADTGFATYLRALRDGEPIAFDTFDPPPDGGRPVSEVVVSGPGEGERLVSGNRSVLLKGVLTDLCVAEWALDGPFDGPEPHTHERQVDAYYVLDGELELTLDGSTRAAGPGTLAAVPRGVSHTFAHEAGRTKVLNVHAPDGGFADFLRRTAGAVRR